jgi:uncharacterized protein YjiS (DUF1127 family)
MSVYETNRSVPLGAITTLRVVQLAERAIEAFRAWRTARATAESLAELSDSQLADIGLHRGEIAEVALKLARS